MWHHGLNSGHVSGHYHRIDQAPEPITSTHGIPGLDSMEETAR